MRIDRRSYAEHYGPTAGDRVRLDTSNSVLDFPRSRVRWDLDGDGQFELDAGRACDAIVTPTQPGRLPVRVEITTQDGKTVTATRTLDVLGDGSARDAQQGA